VGIFPFVGATQAAAEQRHRELQALIDPVVGLSLLEGQLGEVDLSSYPVDGPVPQPAETNASKSRQNLLLELARRDGLTIRDLYKHVAGARGHLQLIGTAQTIADEMEAWYSGGAADGFIVMPPYLPSGFEDFVQLVVPELRRRGLFRKDYEGTTLREHLGLARPSHPSSAPTGSASAT
jgi:alkanesulfonate monooxygenase SsuD/methylene tetrahydromethanopterin reductase-like flavin-dependent oxidoreductase (luciferase family)